MKLGILFLLSAAFALGCGTKLGPAPPKCNPECRSGVACLELCADGGVKPTACVVNTQTQGWVRDSDGTPVDVCPGF